MDYQKLINSNIKKLRQVNSLTQEEFAEKIGLSLQGLSNIERNRYQPNAKTIDNICKAFKICPAELLLYNQNNDNEEIIKNIVLLLNKCSKTKLKKIYNIISILIKL